MRGESSEHVWSGLQARLVLEPVDPIDYYEYELSLRTRPLGDGRSAWLLDRLSGREVVD